MKWHFKKSLLALAAVALLTILAACTSTPYSTPKPTPTPTPTIQITAPADGSTLSAGDITVSVQVSDFNLVDKKGETNVAGEGHIHYFIDVDAPTIQGTPAVTAAGTYAATSATSYIWPNVMPGTHTLSVELVNNNHTPINPPVVATVKVTAKVVDTTTQPATTPDGQAVTVNISAQNIAFDKSTITVPAGANVTLAFNNKEAVPHNVAIYKTQAATEVIYRGETFTGPKTITYHFTAPTTPRTYFFRCDVHPSAMKGSFIVAGTDSSSTGPSTGYGY